ncbi:hypothetical protein GCM10011344_26230 [Dokdonia pacifica]|uniref:Uncharacterized protein n=1 Tax=Dokdonia pacifica TaxID=1627892 RepID=A0A239E361_9FLAO|nr:hypothetical protein [Dokdonia pacifica]GGG24246.1 hypothetical protein GCM10011344_26230 [Dokdonia pacifica]SNS39106.1 hypothetical protein SAMN06265376_11376 [Dokdonia pacifica]
MKNKKKLKELNFEKITISKLKKINIKGGAGELEAELDIELGGCTVNDHCDWSLICSGACCN